MKVLFTLHILIIISISGFTQSGYTDFFTGQALRLDLNHAGNYNSSSVFLEELVQQPRWGGNINQLIDKYEYGNMKVELINLQNQKPIYSKSFSSIFKEWQLTNEAENMLKSFCEPVLCPMPNKPVIIKVSERDSLLQWTEKLIFEFNPDKTPFRKIIQSSFISDSLIYNGSPATHVDLVFIAEGYKKSQMAKFKNDVKRLTDSLFKCQPYNMFAEQFNVWTLNSISADEGCDIPYKDTWRNTVLDCSFSTFGSDRYLQCLNPDKMYDLAANIPFDLAIVLVNSNEYGGGAIYNFITTVTSDNEFSDFVLFHELGHSFAGLADEYYNTEVAYKDFYNKSLEPIEPNITTLVSFDKKWKNMVPPQIPVPTPAIQKYENVIGVFEGAGYSEKGIYRPAISCSMKSNERDNLCPICTKTIIEIITSHIQ